MDNSQSSDCFPESANTSFMSQVTMDTLTYDTLVTNTKQALSAVAMRGIENATFSTHFATLLEDCSTCINQSLDLITEILSNADVCISKLSEYLNDAVSLLQMLSNFLKTVIESVAMTCCTIKTLPVTIGQIIYAVFSHCKDSESLYGNNLGNVEQQLKDLFRNCHELQLIYLMILEKHYIFDLTHNDERDILIQALDINLKTGEIVQSLDVKTMAEQWKAYTMICEKYAAVLSDSNIFQNCSQVLCMLIKNNIHTAVETNQDDKVTLRSLKVASFTIKILLKTFNIFRKAKRKDYADVIDLLFFMHKSRVSHLGMSAQFTNLAVIPSECLLKELLSDETFVNSLIPINVEKHLNEDSLLGFVLTLMSIMKCITQGHKSKYVTKCTLINCVFEILPHCYLLFCQDLTLSSESNQDGSHGLFEYFLIHAASLAFTLNCGEFSTLERCMAEAVLSTDCCSALFSANLWVLIASQASSQLLFNQMIWLCTMYKKLESHSMFYRSPQKVHLSETISRLFGVMENEDKMKICKQFRIHDDDNVTLWTALGVNHLPVEMVQSAEDAVFEKLKTQLHCINSNTGSEAVVQLTKIINLAATCTFTNTRGIEDCILKAWSKTCLKHHFIVQEVDISTVWFYDYVEALVSLTHSVWNKLCVCATLMKVLLHVISNLIQHCSTEFKQLVLSTLCKLATCDIPESKLLDANFTDAFTCLFQHSEDIVRSMLYITLRIYRCDKNLERVLSNTEGCALQETEICAVSNNLKNVIPNYNHKCYGSEIKLSNCSAVTESKKAESSHFDFADINNLFDNDSDSEPMNKKVKLDATEAEAIIKRLETDASLLFNVKENVFISEYRDRIQNVCDKLRNIID